MSLDDDARRALADLATRGLQRTRRTRSSPLAGAVVVDGNAVVDFASNDYLGLAAHPALATAANNSARELGTGAGASRLIIGDTVAHVQLERDLARWLDVPSVLSVGSGYAANTGVIAAFGDADTTIFSDALNHASIIDGCRLARAHVVVYRHGDFDDLAAKLAAATTGRRMVVTESLFSMDGDVVDIAAISKVCKVHEASLILDEAHAVGVLGPRGRGVAAAVGVTPDVVIGTLGKAFGVAGAFVASTSAVTEWLWNRARSVVFSTALPPMCAAAATAALAIIDSADGDARRARLHGHSDRVRAAVAGVGSLGSPIVPVAIGDDRRAVALSSRLAEIGLLVPAIRPPTVPVGTARLRISLSAAHTDDQVTRLLDALRTATC